jgi:hypothetical protein
MLTLAAGWQVRQVLKSFESWIQRSSRIVSHMPQYRPHNRGICFNQNCHCSNQKTDVPAL